MIYREKARIIAVKYLKMQHAESLSIEDTLPKYAHIYTNVPLKDLWFIPVPGDGTSIGCGRMICISKETGQIVYDGPDGGE